MQHFTITNFKTSIVTWDNNPTHSSYIKDQTFLSAEARLALSWLSLSNVNYHDDDYFFSGSAHGHLKPRFHAEARLHFTE